MPSLYFNASTQSSPDTKSVNINKGTNVSRQASLNFHFIHAHFIAFNFLLSVFPLQQISNTIGSGVWGEDGPYLVSGESAELPHRSLCRESWLWTSTIRHAVVYITLLSPPSLCSSTYLSDKQRYLSHKQCFLFQDTYSTANQLFHLLTANTPVLRQDPLQCCSLYFNYIAEENWLFTFSMTQLNDFTWKKQQHINTDSASVDCKKKKKNYKKLCGDVYELLSVPPKRQT